MSLLPPEELAHQGLPKLPGAALDFLLDAYIAAGCVHLAAANSVHPNALHATPHPQNPHLDAERLVVVAAAPPGQYQWATYAAAEDGGWEQVAVHKCGAQGAAVDQVVAYLTK